MDETATSLHAALYDGLGVGWPGELPFYQDLARASTPRGERVLEVACGTGRVALTLAREGASVTGLGASPDMLTVARRNGRDVPNARWVQADMRAFELGVRFGLTGEEGRPSGDRPHHRPDDRLDLRPLRDPSGRRFAPEVPPFAPVRTPPHAA